MNFKKNFKRFFTLSRSADGFTLVELIVVIAILAILGGVAVPAYSGYVKKAETAVEEQQIAMYHSAYVVACVGNSIDPEGYTPSLDWRDGNFYGLTAIQQRAGENPAANAVAEFNAFFGFDGNKFYSFKHKSQAEVADGIKNGIDSEGGTNASMNLPYGNGYITITPAQIEALKNSTFGAMGMGPLLEQLDGVTNIAAGMTENASVANVLNSQGFLNSAAAAMGLDPTKYADTPSLQAAIYAEQQKLAAKRAEANGTNPADEMDQIAANAAVLYVAQQTSQMSTEKMNELMSTATKKSIMDKMNSTDSAVAGEGLAQAALMCGMYTAYVNSDEYKGDAAGKEVNALNVLNALENDDFKTFCAGQQGQDDLSGYMNSLGMISSSTSDKDATSQLLINGFNDPALKELLNNQLK